MPKPVPLSEKKCRKTYNQLIFSNKKAKKIFFRNEQKKGPFQNGRVPFSFWVGLGRQNLIWPRSTGIEIGNWRTIRMAGGHCKKSDLSSRTEYFL
jgi:hypothetical protein